LTTVYVAILIVLVLLWKWIDSWQLMQVEYWRSLGIENPEHLLHEEDEYFMNCEGCKNG